MNEREGGEREGERVSNLRDWRREGESASYRLNKREERRRKEG